MTALHDPADQAAETDSEHPLARAILAAAADRGIQVAAARDFASSPAVGITATVDGVRVRVGGPGVLAESRRVAMVATASTTRPPWPRRTSASPSAPAPTSRSPRPGASWRARTPGPCCR